MLLDYHWADFTYSFIYQVLTTCKVFCYLGTGHVMVNKKEIAMSSKIIKSKSKSNKPNTKIHKDYLNTILIRVTKEKYRLLWKRMIGSLDLVSGYVGDSWGKVSPKRPMLCCEGSLVCGNLLTSSFSFQKHWLYLVYWPSFPAVHFPMVASANPLTFLIHLTSILAIFWALGSSF